MIRRMDPQLRTMLFWVGVALAGCMAIAALAAALAVRFFG
jgi:hypothetical protein